MVHGIRRGHLYECVGQDARKADELADHAANTLGTLTKRSTSSPRSTTKRRCSACFATACARRCR